MTLKNNNQHNLHELAQNESLQQNPLFVFITGASGAGKSFLTHALEQQINCPSVLVAYFDHIGIATVDFMVTMYGSCEQWQEAVTHTWVERLALKRNKTIVILEGQYNPQFAVNACKRFNIQNYLLMVLHADRTVRDARLNIQRQQPELANDTMNNWAEFLKRTTLELGGTVVDTSESDLEQNVTQIVELISEKIKTTL